MENMNSYFENVPSDSDTRIIKTDFKIIKEIPTRLDIWLWDGIMGASAIMPNSFVSHLGDVELVEIVRTEVHIHDGYTVKRSSDFTFINFGFFQDED